MVPEERERQRILSILEQSDSEKKSDIDDNVEEEDHISVQSQPSDTEQECSETESVSEHSSHSDSSDESDDNIPLSQMSRQMQTDTNPVYSQELPVSNLGTSSLEVQIPRYLGRDGTVCLKTPFRQNVRTRAENIITLLPGVTTEAKSACSELECWGLFFSNDMLQKILTHTNVRIQRKISLCVDLSKHIYMKECIMTEFKAFVGLLYISGLINNKSTEKRRNFLKNLGLALVSEHMKIRQDGNRLPREMRKRIRQFVGESSEEPPAKVPNARKRCQVCPAQKDRKTKHTCHGCYKYVCPEHIIPFCSDCVTNDDSD